MINVPSWYCGGYAVTLDGWMYSRHRCYVMDNRSAKFNSARMGLLFLHWAIVEAPSSVEGYLLFPSTPILPFNSTTL